MMFLGQMDGTTPSGEKTTSISDYTNSVKEWRTRTSYLTLFQDPKEIAVIIGPELDASLGCDFRRILHLVRPESRRRIGEQHPGGAEHVLRIVVVGIDHAGQLAEFPRLPLHHRLQVEIAVGD